MRGYKNEEEQWQLTAGFIRQMCRFLRLKASTAVILVPSSRLGLAAAENISKLGLPASFMKSHELRLDSPDVKVLTMHSAKGLEFPVVVVLGLQEGIITRLPDDLLEEEREEEIKSYRRLFYVRVTRAMRGVLVLYPKEAPSMFIYELSFDHC